MTRTQPPRARPVGRAAVLLLLGPILGFVPRPPAAVAPNDVSATPRGVTVPAAADGFVDPSQLDRMTGGSPVLMAGDEGLDGRVTYLKFAVPSLPADATDVSATLVLDQVGLSGPASSSGTWPVVRVYGTATDWDPSTMTAANAPSAGAVLARAPLGASGSSTRIALGSTVVTPGQSVAFALTSVTGEQSAISFASNENSDVTFRPRLVIDYVLRGQCSVSALLVPACGAWFGSTVNPMGGESTAADAVAREESELGRKLDIVHTYHRADEDWPTATELALVSSTTRPRLLMVNWKPEVGNTWAAVAAGASDGLIDAAAGRISARLGSTPFFLALHHEPEDEVKGAGSGYTPADYVAMFRHVVQRLRSDGAGSAVVVWDAMGYSGWGEQGLYPQLYPGDDVVDWIGYDPYSHRGLPLTTFANGPGRTFPGFYSWATSAHPDKPLMLAEFGVEAPTAGQRASVFDTFAAQARELPVLKAFVYFDHSPDSTTATYDYSLESDLLVLGAAKAAFSDPYFQP